jgi:hypothetical protein
VRIAWLRPTSPTDGVNPLDDTAPLVDELSRRHDIELIDAGAAHDLVWRDAREPFDLFIHEMAADPRYGFVAPYAVHFPGVLLLKDFAPHASRAIPASRLVVVGDEAVAASLRETYAKTPIMSAPLATKGSEPGSDPYWRETQIRLASGKGARFGLLTGRGDVVERAAARARAAGVTLDLITGAPADVLAHAAVVIALDWPPPAGPPAAALAAMAAGRPVIVFESLVTAGWPALDPQTWQPRGFSRDAADPIVVSIDPRDEEHSLMLAMERLASEPALRTALGTAGRAWSDAHAQPAHAVEAWRRILEGPGLPPSPPFPGADGSEHLRATLAEFGVTVDLP